MVAAFVFHAGRLEFKTSTEGLEIIEEKGLPLH